MKLLSKFVHNMRTDRDFFELIVKIDLAISAIFPFIVICGGTSLLVDSPTALRTAIAVSLLVAIIFVILTLLAAHDLRKLYYGYKETKAEIKKGK